LNYKKCRNPHRWISSVKKYTEMLTKTTGSSNFLFQICQTLVKTGRTSLSFFVKIRDKEIVLRRKDILLDAELARIPCSDWAFAFP